MTRDSSRCSVLPLLSYGQVTPLLLTISTHSHLLSGVKKDNRILDKAYGPLKVGKIMDFELQHSEVLWLKMSSTFYSLMAMKNQIRSVLGDIHLLCALSKHGYFPSKVSVTSAPSCVITCLILQVQKSFFLSPTATQTTTFVSAGFPFWTLSSYLPQVQSASALSRGRMDEISLSIWRSCPN